MNLLPDTHILIWALTDDPRLPEKAKKLILRKENTIYYSVVSLWEVSARHALPPDHLTFSGEELAAFCSKAGYYPLEMKERHVFALETLVRKEDAPRHQDPFSRMLIAQAKAENCLFLTHDALLAAYDEKCILYLP